MCLVTAAIFGPHGPRLSLHETDESDVKIVRDYNLGWAKVGARGVRVKVL